MKTEISDFNGQYKAFYVSTDEGLAFQGKNCGRAVDIGFSATIVFNTRDIKALYSDTCALALDNPTGWPGKVRIQSADIHLVTLSATFNEIVRLGADLSRKHGGRKLNDVPHDDNKISQIFAECARNRLSSLEQFFVTSRALLETFGPQDRDLPQIEQGMGDSYQEIPNETVALFANPDDILPAMHTMLLLNEIDFPGYASTNRYYISGLYTAPAREATLPLPKQSPAAPLARVLPELHRVMMK